jgi:hypothetical protein
MDSRTDAPLYSIWGFGENRVYAAGDNNNEICYYDGKTWCPVPILDVPMYDVQGIWGTSPADLFVADHRGTIAHFDGYRWNELERLFSGGPGILCGNDREAILFGAGIASYRRH